MEMRIATFFQHKTRRPGVSARDCQAHFPWPYHLHRFAMVVKIMCCATEAFALFATV